jgi:hypothetical protein
MGELISAHTWSTTLKSCINIPTISVQIAESAIPSIDSIPGAIARLAAVTGLMEGRSPLGRRWRSAVYAAALSPVSTMMQCASWQDRPMNVPTSPTCTQGFSLGIGVQGLGFGV